jgi:hypothetical protein
MKHTIKTTQGTVTFEPGKAGGVLITVKPHIWPALMMTVTPNEAAMMSTALDQIATSQEATA